MYKVPNITGNLLPHTLSLHYHTSMRSLTILEFQICSSVHKKSVMIKSFRRKLRWSLYSKIWDIHFRTLPKTKWIVGCRGLFHIYLLATFALLSAVGCLILFDRKSLQMEEWRSEILIYQTTQFTLRLGERGRHVNYPLSKCEVFNETDPWTTD